MREVFSAFKIEQLSIKYSNGKVALGGQRKESFVRDNLQKRPNKRTFLIISSWFVCLGGKHKNP
jgi:hypothetical protein